MIKKSFKFHVRNETANLLQGTRKDDVEITLAQHTNEKLL